MQIPLHSSRHLHGSCEGSSSLASSQLPSQDLTVATDVSRPVRSRAACQHHPDNAWMSSKLTIKMVETARITSVVSLESSLRLSANGSSKLAEKPLKSINTVQSSRKCAFFNAGPANVRHQIGGRKVESTAEIPRVRRYLVARKLVRPIAANTG